MTSMTYSQQVALALLPKITGWSSLVFSTCLATHIVRGAAWRRSCYHRLMLGVSVADISASFWHGMSTWPIPAGEQLWAVGNDCTCRLQGFFTQNSIISSFYNASLSVYFYLVIVRGWKEEDLRRIESILHFIPLSFGLITAVIGLILDMFGNALLWCWVPSEQQVFRWAAYYVPLWTMISIVTICCIAIYSHVRHLERQAELCISGKQDAVGAEPTRVRFGDLDEDDEEEVEAVVAQPSEINISNVSQEGHACNVQMYRRPQRVKQVAQQCFLYAAAFYVNWSSLTVSSLPRRLECRHWILTCYTYLVQSFPLFVLLKAVRFIQAFGGRVPVSLVIISAVTVPIQGLPNFLVYLRPKLQRAYRRNPKERWCKYFARSVVAWNNNSEGVSMSRRHTTTHGAQSEIIDLERVNEHSHEDQDTDPSSWGDEGKPTVIWPFLHTLPSDTKCHEKERTNLAIVWILVVFQKARTL